MLEQIRHSLRWHLNVRYSKKSRSLVTMSSWTKLLQKITFTPAKAVEFSAVTGGRG
jgi:hypothetical protein